MEKEFVCQCKEVTRQEIENLIKRHKVHCVHDLQQLTGAGTGCKRCYASLEALTKELVVQFPDPQLLIPFVFEEEESENETDEELIEEAKREDESTQQLSLF